MSELKHAPLRALHLQFLDAAEKFPFLYCAAVIPYSADPLWPKTLNYPEGLDRAPEGFHLGLSAANWRDVLGIKNPPLPSFPLCNTRWLRIDNRLWEAAFYDHRESRDFRTKQYGTTGADSAALQAGYAHAMEAVAEFERLARHCAGNLDLKRGVLREFRKNGLKADDRADAWLDILFMRLFVEQGGPENVMLVRRLPCDVFTASARAIELIDKRAPSATRALFDLAVSERDLVMIALELDRRSPEQQARFDAWEREAGSFPSGKTPEVLAELQPSSGYCKLDLLYHDAVGEALQTGAGNYLLPKLEAAKTAHSRFLEEARHCYERRRGTESLQSHIEHCEALKGLDAVLKGLEAALRPPVRFDSAAAPLKNQPAAVLPRADELATKHTMQTANGADGISQFDITDGPPAFGNASLEVLGCPPAPLPENKLPDGIGKLPSSGANTRANTRQKKLSYLPENPEVAKLMRELDANKGDGVSEIQLARGLFPKKAENKIKSLMTQVRRFRRKHRGG